MPGATLASRRRLDRAPRCRARRAAPRVSRRIRPPFALFPRGGPSLDLRFRGRMSIFRGLHACERQNPARSRRPHACHRRLTRSCAALHATCCHHLHVAESSQRSRETCTWTRRPDWRVVKARWPLGWRCVTGRRVAGVRGSRSSRSSESVGSGGWVVHPAIALVCVRKKMLVRRRHHSLRYVLRGLVPE